MELARNKVSYLKLRTCFILFTLAVFKALHRGFIVYKFIKNYNCYNYKENVTRISYRSYMSEDEFKKRFYVQDVKLTPIQSNEYNGSRPGASISVSF